MKIITLILFVCFSSLPTVGFTDTEDEIWAKLKKGGLVVLVRHTSVEKTNNSLFRDPSCLMERRLSAKGKKEAAILGEIFANKGIVINAVLASPYCRTTATAKIAFDKYQSADFLSVISALSEKKADENTSKLAQTIGSYSGTGNLILVTHAQNINAVSFESINLGSFLVLQPTGAHEFDEIGTVNLLN